MLCVVTVFILSNIESNKSKCCPAPPGKPAPLHENILNTPVVSSIHLGSIIIFAICVIHRPLIFICLQIYRFRRAHTTILKLTRTQNTATQLRSAERVDGERGAVLDAACDEILRQAGTGVRIVHTYETRV